MRTSSYIDPGDIVYQNTPSQIWDDPAETYIRSTQPGEVPNYPSLRNATRDEKALAHYLKYRLNYGGEVTQPDFLDPVDILSDPGFLRSLTKGLAGAGMGGMIRMGGKEFPNAMLHRAIGDPKELDWWGKLFQRGLSSEKPTSVVTPSVLQTFQSEPYGLLFNVPEEKAIKWASPVDAESVSEAILPPHYERAIEAMRRHNKPIQAEVLQSWIEKIWPPDVFKNASIPQRWLSTSARHTDYEPQTYRLDSLLSDQLSDLKHTIREQSGMPEEYGLIHSEVVPEIDRSMLAGVRLPLKPEANKKGAITSFLAKNPGPEEHWDAGGFLDNLDPAVSPMYKALTDFAEAMNVPIYRWPAVETQAQQLKGLETPFAGKWGYKPGSRDYITSSMLKKIFGIDMGDLP